MFKCIYFTKQWNVNISYSIPPINYLSPSFAMMWGRGTPLTSILFPAADPAPSRSFLLSYTFLQDFVYYVYVA